MLIIISTPLLICMNVINVSVAIGAYVNHYCKKGIQWYLQPASGVLVYDFSHKLLTPIPLHLVFLNHLKTNCMNWKLFFSVAISLATITACNNTQEAQVSTAAETVPTSGQSGVKDDESQKDVVKVAVGSKDHTTLVKALQSADLVNSLSNAGPFTVFAPTNAAFDKLPAGTVDGLLQPEKKSDLQDILQYHVSVGVFKPEMLQDGQSIGQVNGKKISIGKKDGRIMINGTANVVATIPASNGIIYVVDGVLLPPK
jgi:uncharacterized surface protein with fasciclin (FAS1) repeats